MCARRSIALAMAIAILSSALPAAAADESDVKRVQEWRARHEADYNPPCAFNEFTTCPLPLPENRLMVRIPAGELAYIGKAK